MLALGRGRLRDGAGGLRWAAAERWGGDLKTADITAAGQRQGQAQQGRRSQKAAAHRVLAPCRTVDHFGYSSFATRLIPAHQLDLSHPEHFDSRPGACLNPAANTNLSIFQRLEAQSGSLEGPDHAP